MLEFLVVTEVVGFESVILLGFIHAGGWDRDGLTCELLLPLVSLHVGPLLDEIFGLRTDFDLKDFVEQLDVDEESAYSEDFLASFEFKMAERKKTPSIISCPFEVFDIAELVEEPLHQLVAALLRYILDKHFLPHFLLRSHCIAEMVLGTPRGLTVILPPWVIMGVIVKGSNTALSHRYPHQGYRCNYAESFYNYYKSLLSFIPPELKNPPTTHSQPRKIRAAEPTRGQKFGLSSCTYLGNII